MIETIAIPRRFNGPPTTGNGGYSAGVVAALLGQPPAAATRVTLHRPPPLDTELTVRHDHDHEHEHDTVAIFDRADLVADAVAGQLDDASVVPAVLFADAAAAATRYPGFVHHPFPTCFVCGPDRDDGLGLFPGRLADGRTAAPFVVPVEISPLLLWAALDCPGGWAAPQGSRPYVLGRITARVVALPAAGDECVAMGRLDREDGRKAFVSTTVYAATGGVLAQASATWIALPDA